MRKLTLVIMAALFIISVNRLSAQHPIVAVIDSCKEVIAAAPIGPALWTEYSQASVDGINYFIKQADSISAGSDEAKKTNAISDLRYYMSRFAVNPGLPAANTYSEDFNGIIKYNLWNELGGLNGISQSIDNGALKFDCYSNGSMWFSEKITFGQAPQPLTMDLKEYPYVSFKAKAAPGATYDGVVVDSVNITFNDNYQPYQVFKIPADGAWHDVLFDLPNTQLASYTGYDQFWLNPGMEQGHFSSEFIGTVWIDDFKAGKATNMPAIKSELANLIDSCKAVIAAAPIGPALWTEYSQASVDGINYFIKQADSISAGSDEAKKTNAISDLRYYMSRFAVNPGLPAANTYSEDFNGIIKYNLWNELGGLNGITQSIDNGALKFDCYSNGSMWFSPKITFSQAPQPLTMDLKEYPYVSFKAKAAPGATYDGVVVDSVNITFNDNYQPYQVFKIPADGAWHNVLFNLPNTQLATYTGYDQFWLNPGMEQGHFSSEFIGTVWIDDFKAGKAVGMPAAESDLATLIDSCNTVIAAAPIGADPGLYAQATVDGINTFIAQAETISAGSDDALKTKAVDDLRYYMSLFKPNPAIQILDSFTEDFSGIVKQEIWNTLGGANGIVPTIENGALKYNCTANGSFWFQSQLRFWAQPLPIVMELKTNPYVSFKAMAEPGATYDGFALDSVSVAFNDNYGEYQSLKIPADSTWHELTFFLTGTTSATYSGYDQWWINPGLTVADGHFSHEFIGNVWIDDFKAGKAVKMPAPESDLATLIDSCNTVIAAAPIGADPGLYSQATVDGINTFIAQAETISAGSDNALKTEAVKDLRYYMSLFKPNPAIQILDSFTEDFSGIVKQEIWNTLGGANGILPTFENGALKYTCTSNGSYWFQSQLRFWAQPLPIVMELKANPYVSFKAMAEPGATYDGYALDSVSVSFTDNYGEYQSLKIPADSTWHEVTFFLAGTTSATYSGFDQWWINPGLTVTDGHFSHEFIGSVWIDDFKAGKAVILPDASNLVALIDSSSTAVSAVIIGDLPGQYSQQTVDAANAAIAIAQSATTKIVQDQVDQAEVDLRAAMSLFQANLDHTAVNKYSSAGLKMYPNPVSDVLTISKVNRNSTLFIYSLSGKKVMKIILGQQEEAKINLRELQPGTYMVKMTSDKGTSIGKIIKK